MTHTRFFKTALLLAISTSVFYTQATTVLLTGAAGFIGSNFLQYMFDKYPAYNFTVLDNLTYAGSLDNIPDYIKHSKRFKFVYGSVTNASLVEHVMADATFVVHFAAESHVTKSIYDDEIFFTTDVLGTRCMMNALVKNRDTVQRFIHISTSEVCGTAETEPMDENHPLNPRSPYAAAKAGADRLVYAYCCTYDVPAVIIRPFNNFGPRQHPEKLIPRFVSKALRGKKLPIQGDGNQKRDWVHTLDLADALDRALHIPDFSAIKGQVIHVGSGKAVSVLEIARMVLKEFNLGDDQLKFVDDRPGQVRCHISTTEKAQKLLGWHAKQSIRDGIKDVIKWYAENQSWWKSRLMLKKIPYESIPVHYYRKTVKV